MKTWMKWALGCLGVMVIGTFLLVAGLVGFGYWAKNRLQEAVSGGPEVEQARKAANQAPFARPANDLVAEARLEKFIKVRAEVFNVYERYKSEIDARAERLKKASTTDVSDLASDVATGFTFMSEIQKAEAFALAKQQMSEDEYAFITEQVYRSMLSGHAEELADGPSKKTRQEAADKVKAIKTEGMPKEAQEAIDAAAKQIAEGQESATKALESLKVPPENAALFKKYEADLKKYAMPGLFTLLPDRDKAAAPTPAPR